MKTRKEVVEAARTWIGTPFHHQATLKGIGCDCAGLIRGVMIETDYLRADWESVPRACEFTNYPRIPDGIALMDALNYYLTKIPMSAMQPGDIVCVRFGAHPQHVGILGDYRHGGLSIIHAASNGSNNKVIETRLMFSEHMKFVAAFKLPGIE